MDKEKSVKLYKENNIQCNEVFYVVITENEFTGRIVATKAAVP